MSHRRTGVLLAVASSALLLAGCGGSDDAAGAPASPPAASSSASASASSGGGSASVDYDTIAVPDEFGGGTVPVPPGLTPEQPTTSDGTWKFEVNGIGKEEGVAFYREALTATGYTIDVENDLLVVASDGERSVTATLSPGSDGVDVIVQPAS